MATIKIHDDVIKWKHFPRYWPFVWGIPVNSPHKAQWRGALMFSLICARIYGWVNNREAGDLRRHRAHYDVIEMCLGGRITHLFTQGTRKCDNQSSSRSRFLGISLGEVPWFVRNLHNVGYFRCKAFIVSARLIISFAMWYLQYTSCSETPTSQALHLCTNV